jgi:hypothetical protein
MTSLDPVQPKENLKGRGVYSFVLMANNCSRHKLGSGDGGFVAFLCSFQQ